MGKQGRSEFSVKKFIYMLFLPLLNFCFKSQNSWCIISHVPPHQSHLSAGQLWPCLAQLTSDLWPILLLVYLSLYFLNCHTQTTLALLAFTTTHILRLTELRVNHRTCVFWKHGWAYHTVFLSLLQPPPLNMKSNINLQDSESTTQETHEGLDRNCKISVLVERENKHRTCLMSRMRNALNYEAVACRRKPKTTSCGHYWRMTHFIVLAGKQDCAFCCPSDDITCRRNTQKALNHSGFEAF